ncbi:MAG: ATP-dependent Clp protease proteolytic subunit [Candidatus Zixiibacteriota bacterium]|jgi:ClpP class serine protease
MGFTDIFWIFLVIALVLPILQKRFMESRRLGAMRAIEKKRKSRVIAMVHRQETMSLLGFPIMRYIDINDSEDVMRAVRLTDDNVPIDFILHTPGGLILATDQIAQALLRHPAKVTVFVPHYAMSGGTLIALAADEIVMAPNAVLGPIDPQIGGLPAASIIKATELKRPGQNEDQTLIMADIAGKALKQLRERVKNILARRMEIHAADELAVKLTKGTWTHDYPITCEEAEELGFPVSEDMPAEIYDFMKHFPQAKRKESSVQFVPIPYRHEGGEGEKEK